jgi:type I restriction enzyme, S subunit
VSNTTGWVSAALSDLVQDISYGFTASATNVRCGPRLLRITDLQNGTVAWHTVPFCQCDDTAKYLLRPGDIVIARTGATTGKSFLLTDIPEPTVFASYLIRLAQSAHMNPRFIPEFMKSPDYWDQITVVSKGTAQPGANASILGRLTVPVAPLNEQRRIVSKIDAVNAKSRRAKEALETIPPLLEKFRQSILAAAFRGDLTADWRAKNPDVEPASALLGRIRTERRRRWEEAELEKLRAKGTAPKDDHWKAKYQEPAAVDTEGLPELPEGWVWASVDDVSELVQYGSSAKATSMDDVPVLRMGNIADGELTYDDLKYLPTSHAEFPDLLLADGDILFNRTNSPELVGKTAVFRDQGRPTSFASYLIRVRVLFIEPELVSSYLNSPYGKAWIRSQVSQQVGQANVNGTKLKALMLPLPPVEEQKRLTSLLARVTERVVAAQQKVDELRNLSAALDAAVLSKAFRGELVPQDPNDEPASVLLERIRAERDGLVPASSQRIGRKRAPKRQAAE